MEEAREKREEVFLTGKLYEFRQALREEIDAIERTGHSSTILRSGRRIAGNNGDFWYSFKVEYLPAIPADTPCKLVVENNNYNVTVVGFDESEIIIASSIALPENIGYAKLENGSTVLMERLIQRIEDTSVKNNPAGNRMLPENGDGVFHPIHNYDFSKENGLAPAQSEAIRSSLTNDITYIWGPPGTGKTTVIGKIIKRLFEDKRTVLVVSHTNTAVDGAIEKACRDNDGKVIVRADGSCPVLRIGIPQKELPAEVGIDHHVKLLGEDLYNRQTNLKEKRREDIDLLNELSLTIDKIRWIRTSSLSEIDEQMINLSALHQALERSNASLNAEINRVKGYLESHPEIEGFEELLDKRAELEDNLRIQNDLIVAIEKKTVDIKAEIDFSNGEYSKHISYEKLKEQLASYMAEEFLRQKIGAYALSVKNLSDERTYLVNAYVELRDSIDKLTRNAITTALNKKKIEDAKEKQQYITDRVSEIDAQVSVENKTIESYESDLVSVQSIKTRMADIDPTQTKEYWEAKCTELMDVLAKTIAATEPAKMKAAEINTELNECVKRIQELQDVSSPYLVIRESLNKENSVNQDLQNKQRDLILICNELVNKEVQKSGGFIKGIVNETTLPEKYEIIKRAIIETSFEVDGKDEEEIKKEIGQINIEVRSIDTELREIDEKINNLKNEAINRAEIIGATLAKTYLSDELQARDFDTVILDEASMASIPALWCASFLAKNNIIIVGDFLQLPPIVLADTPMAKKWLGTDIFIQSGMRERAKNRGSRPANFIMLNEQFRMEKDIADIANRYYGDYGGLITKEGIGRKDDRDKFYSWYPGKPSGKSVEIVDTKNLHAWVTSIPQGKNHNSRLNCVSAALTVAMAFRFIMPNIEVIRTEKEPRVLIVAPYKPHIDRVKKLIDIGYRQYGLSADSNLINAGTIHSFQGNEADIVIFDMVVDEPHWRNNLFISSEEANENLRKMFNVAITRAKFRLFIVGNIDYCRKRAKDNELGQLLRFVVDDNRSKIIDAKDMYPSLKISIPSSFVGEIADDGQYIICRETEYFDYLQEDINIFKTRMIIFSPFIASNRMAVLLPLFRDAISSNKSIVVITKALSDRGKRELAQYQRIEEELRAIGVTVIHKKGMHEKIVIVDDSAVWLGSLNTLSFAGNTGEIMTKYCDEEYTRKTEEMYSIPQIQESINDGEELKCPICGSRMILGEGDKGGLYWFCESGDYSRNMDQQYPHDGVLRCRCGCDYVFKMKNQPRWVCSDNPKHYQAVRYGDLKLKNMLKLIPKKDRKMVYAYFSDLKNKDRGIKKESAHKDENSKGNAQITLMDLGMKVTGDE